MICTSCYKSFEGIGVVCPNCAQAQAQLELLRSVHPEEMKQEQTGEDNFAPHAEDSLVFIPLGERPARFLAFFAEAFFTLPVVGGALIIALLQLRESDSLLLQRLILDGPSSLVPSSKEILRPAILWFQVSLVSLSVLYFTLFEVSPYRATPGKLLLGLMVCDARGDNPGLMRILIRNLSRYILLFPALAYMIFDLKTTHANCALTECQQIHWTYTNVAFFITILVPFLTYAFYLFSRTHQGLHDIIPATYVARVHDFRSNAITVALIAGLLGILVWSLPYFWIANMDVGSSPQSSILLVPDRSHLA